MVERLQRLLLLTVLFSLVTARHLPVDGRLGSGIWESEVQTDLTLLIEEEAESEPEAEDLHKRDGGDDGDFSQTQKEDGFSNSSTSASLFAEFLPNHVLFPYKTFTAFQIKASISALANSSKPLLFLLFHNIKSDLAHPAA